MLTAALTGDLAAALDPVAFGRPVLPQPDPWQIGVLRSTARQLILNCCRQIGKSTVTAILAAHTATYEPGSLALLLSPSERQSVELLRKVRAALGGAAPGGHPAAPLTVDNVLSVELANGSRVVALPGKEATIRGFSGVRLLIVDEAARVPDPLYQAARPMLAMSGGRLVLLSTPWGKRGFFHHEWSEGEGWERVEVPAIAVARFDPAWLAAERAAIGEWWYAQEYACQFVETTDQVFGYDEVMAALSPEVAPLFGEEV